MNKVSKVLTIGFPVLALSALLPVGSAVAQHGPHVHSISNGTLAVDQNQIEFTLQSPGSNLVGFEHPPRNEEQTATFKQAKAVLETGDWVLFDPASGCSIVEIELETPGFHAAEEHDHHDHNHDHEHAHEHGDDDHHHHADHDHKDDHEHNHDHNSGHKHAEFHLRLQAECENIDQLGWITFELFDGWPDNQELKLDVLTDRIQQRFELSADNNRVELN